MTDAPARPASTVVLLRSGRPAMPRPEVFLVRRHDNIAFMGGAHVFPGGRVDDTDHIKNAASLCDGVATAIARMRDLSADAAIAHHIAAIRELFEEAGILLARRDGAIIAVEAESAPRFQTYRQQLIAGDISLRDIVTRERVRLAFDELAYFAHWVTPDVETKRFDTRFFVASAPTDQDAAHDQVETTHGEWIAPADAIARCRANEIALPPPTWTTLRQLEAFAGVEDAMTWARAREVPRVQPRVVEEHDRRMVLLPGDPLNDPIPGFDPRETRFILDKGRWQPAPRPASE